MKPFFTVFCFLLVIVSSPDIDAQDESARKGTNKVEPATLRVTAIRALQAGESAKAIEAVDKLLKQSPNDAGNLRLAGDVYLRSGKSKQAAELFDRYLKA